MTKGIKCESVRRFLFLLQFRMPAANVTSGNKVFVFRKHKKLTFKKDCFPGTSRRSDHNVSVATKDRSKSFRLYLLLSSVHQLQMFMNHVEL